MFTTELNLPILTYVGARVLFHYWELRNLEYNLPIVTYIVVRVGFHFWEVSL